MLADVPPVPERILELAVPVAPEHVGRRLAYPRPGRDRACEPRVGVVDLQRQHHRRAADGGRGQHPQLGKLVRQVQQAAADPELDRHQPPVRYRDPAHLLGPECLGVEGCGALGALDHDVRDDWHSPTVGPMPRPAPRHDRDAGGPADVLAAKAALRQEVWSAMRAAKVARFPGAAGRIPNFTGAEAAAELLRGTPEWQAAATVKANPDSAQWPVRQRALEDGKTVYMAVPRLAGPEPFFALDPG